MKKICLQVNKKMYEELKKVMPEKRILKGLENECHSFIENMLEFSKTHHTHPKKQEKPNKNKGF